ncbi:class I SAM-dependent methyltransferase, partial [Acinetobacter baumannii]
FPTCSIIGTDFSIKAIEIANSKSNFFNLKFQVENAEELSFADNTFDYIISCETLEHVLHPQLMLNEICRVLKRGGEFVLTTE